MNGHLNYFKYFSILSEKKIILISSMPPKRVRSKKASSKKISQTQLAKLKKEFDSIDTDKSGELD